MSFVDYLRNKLGGFQQQVVSHVGDPLRAQIQQHILNPINGYFTPTNQVRTRDIFRELPSATRQVAGSLVQSTARIAPAIGGTVLHPLTPASQTPQPGWQQKVFGSEPIYNLKGTVQKNAPVIQQKTGLPSIAAKPLAVAGFALANAPGFGGASKELSAASKAIAATEDVGKIAKTLDKLGITHTPELLSALQKETNLTKTEGLLSKFVPAKGVSEKIPLPEKPTMPPIAEKPIQTSTGLKVSNQSSTQDYIKSQINAQQQALKVEKGGTLSRAGAFISDVKRKLVDSTAPIEDILYKAKKAGADIKPSQDITNQIDRVYRSRQLAAQFAKDNGLVDMIKNVPDVHALDQYLIALHAPEVATTTGRNAAADAQLVKDLAPTYQPFADEVIKYGQGLLDKAVETGLVSQTTADGLRAKYPNYVPLNRIFNEVEQGTTHFNTPGVASLSKQTVVQGLKGSERAIQNPTESLLQKTLDVFSQGERNVAGKLLASYKDLPGNPFEITPLRTAENVTKRIDLYSQAKDLKPVQNLYQRLLTTRSRWARSLQSEINKLNQKGLYASLKQSVTESPTIRSSVEQKSTFKKNLVDIGTDQFYAPEITPTIKLKQSYAVPSKSQLGRLMDNLVNLPSSEISKIKSKIATRENGLGKVMDQVAEMSDILTSIKSQRNALFDEAALLRDAKSKGLDTFSTLNNGIKEIYQTTPEIAQAAKLLDKQQLGIVGKIFAFPVRVARVGITGLNLPFIASNIAKDQVTATINTSKALETSIANPPVFLKALWSAVGHGTEYDNWIRSAGGGTSFDISREAPNITISQIRSGRNIGSKIAYTVTHPGELFRAAENIVARGEEVTRLQQFIGTRDSLLKQGMNAQEANIAAAKQSREATVNFARSGDWGKALNSAFLYINAGIQGSRTLVRNLANRPLQTAGKIALTVFTPLAAVTAWNMSDPQRKAAYDDIRDFEKENNLVIVPPNPTKDPKTGKWNVIKIPFSQEIANLTVPIRKGIEALQGADPPGFTEIAKALIGSTTSLNVQNANQFIGQFTPQAVKPGLEAVLNKTLFTGQDTVPASMQNLPPSMQVRDNTSGTARIAGGLLNTSPLKVEQFVKGTFGGVGSQALNASDTALAGAGVIPKDQIGGQSIIQGLKSRFSEATGGQQLSNLYGQTNNKSKSTNLNQGIVENNGSFYVKIGKTPKAFDTQEEAQLALEKDTFDKSGKTQGLSSDGSTVFYRKGGKVLDKPKSEYDYALNTNKMQRAKLANDYKGWQKLAVAQLDSLYQQLQDPSLDELTQSDLLEKADKLTSDLEKYQGYGGFKKPKKGKSIKISSSKASVPKFAGFSPPKVSLGSTSKIRVALQQPNLSINKPAVRGGAPLRAIGSKKIRIVR